MKRLSGILLLGFLIFAAAPAWAQNAYISGNLGFGIRPDADIRIFPPASGPFENDPAFVINGAIGIEIQHMFRLEGEIGYHVNNADQGFTPVDWTFRTISFMVNGYFDFPTPLS